VLACSSTRANLWHIDLKLDGHARLEPRLPDQRSALLTYSSRSSISAAPRAQPRHGRPLRRPFKNEQAFKVSGRR